MAGHPIEWYGTWVDNHGGIDGGGVEALRAEVALGHLGDQNARGAQAWLDRHDQVTRDAQAAAAQALNTRGVLATESPATTARNAFWVAVSALVVSVAIALTVWDLSTRH